MTDLQTPAVPSMTRVQVRLGDLGLARENLRYGEPADDGVPQLADTIHAAGVVIPPIVRPGRKDEQAFMVLDGRRRRFGLILLRDRGDITNDYVVECLLASDKATQAAAIVLPNAERAPVHIADIIIAIGRLRKSRMDTRAISKALGYDELEVRRLEALAAVHPSVLKALRQGRLTLKQVRLFARLPDKAQQAEIAQTALDGHFQDYQLRHVVDRDRATAEDDRLRLVGLDRYLAAGGRVSADLFGELPDSLLDPEILQTLWRERVQPLVDHFSAAGLCAFVGRESAYRAPDGFSNLPYVYPRELSEAQTEALASARAGVARLHGQLQDLDATTEDAPAALIPLFAGQMEIAAAPLTRSRIGAVLLAPGDAFGVAASFFSAPIANDDLQDVPQDGDDDAAAEVGEFDRTTGDVEVPLADVDVTSSSHALHETRTDVATRGLIRDLADDPSAALTVLVAQLFKALALQGFGGVDESATAIMATGYRRAKTPAIPALDGDVRARLDARRAAYKASGLRPIPFVETLPHGEKIALLAELVAITLNVREGRTSALRHAARAEAAEIAALCGADISAHWTPDGSYLAVHSKKQLSELLAQMGAEDERATALKKDDLVTFVAEAAAERRWAPEILAWDRSSDHGDMGDRPDDEGAAEDDPAGRVDIAAVATDESPAQIAA